MKEKMKMIALALLCASSSLFAQNTVEDFLGKDDPIPKNLVKVNALCILSGEVPISYERFFGSSFSLQAGVHIILPYYTPTLFQVLGNDSKISNPKLSFGYSIAPKFYFRGNAPEASYYGLLFRSRRFDAENAIIKYNDLNFIGGWNFVFGNNLVLGIYSGIGMSYRDIVYKTNSNFYPGTERRIGLELPLGVELGYLF